ncbi:hypothetical protein I2I05_00480 [Hymenobacter sp. BT683]|uniref:DoxX family membrane protein n=1 Tax=Hymenobacter jeongseonensis TaxID=2791027 RepID=A0ABS0IC01_9BACT|nr:hypothetical protein [Hymenobacter jeongseonensis]MBF9235860.1 hypothetical protein [Hymenobacter jeongseonensis]
MAPQTHTTTLQNVARGILGTFMIVAGTGHLTFQRQEFQAQVPDFVPFDKDTVVLQSGVVEIGLGLALLLLKGRNRVRMGVGLAAFYALVFPGNVHQYTHHISAFGLDTDAKRLGRLFFQPVLMGWALWSTGALTALRARPQQFQENT